ncbi:MAG: hypothetical protein M1826_004748 [Phylliscum demangeonii]|nr:MAG: hypothetical protein M1826_004748 [Phylliscum demangeonii]
MSRGSFTVAQEPPVVPMALLGPVGTNGIDDAAAAPDSQLLPAITDEPGSNLNVANDIHASDELPQQLPCPPPTVLPAPGLPLTQMEVEAIFDKKFKESIGTYFAGIHPHLKEIDANFQRMAEFTKQFTLSTSLPSPSLS